MKIFFSQSNLSRKPEFQITTKMIEEKNKVFVRKEIAHPQAIEFHNQMVKNESLIKKILVNVKLPKIINKENQFTDFEYLNYPSLEYLIEQSLIIGDFQKAEALYLTFLDFINKQPVSLYDFLDNNKFSFIFGRPYKINIKKNAGLKVGILDFNLDNLLFNSQNKKIYLIDWEWVFDFPIPKNFVIFRSLFYLSVHLQSIIKTLCSVNFPCIEIIKNFYVPKIFWQHSSFSSQEIRLFLTMEINFQNFVLTTPPKYDQDIFLDNLNEKTDLSGKSLNLNAQKTTQNNSHGNIENEILRQELETLRQQLQKIQSSKTYKIWQGYCKITKRLGLKK